MQFFLRLCREVVTEMATTPFKYDYHDGSEPVDMPKRDRYFYGILFTQMIFEEIARNDGFCTFATVKSLWDKEESFFKKLFWEKWTSRLGYMMEVVYQWNYGVDVSNVSP